MYLYYDKTRTLKTTIAHGEPIRQNSDINIFVCLDYDFFENIGISDEIAETSEIITSVTYENGSFGTDNNTSSTPELIPFEKVNSSEITYYLKNGEMYWTYQLKFDAKEISLYAGKIYLNANLIVNGTSYAFGVADLYVEARTGLPSVDDSISQTEYDNFTMRLNKIANRVTILEQTGTGGGGQDKLTDLTNTVWEFNDEITFDSIVNVESWEKIFKINFISNDENWDKIQIMEGDVTTGFDSISYYLDSDSKSVYAFWDMDEDGIPGWERTDGYYQEIKIIDGEDVKNVELINWLYENAKLISSGGSSSGGGLILDDYYDKTQTDEKFATKQELLDQINKILGEGTIEQLDTIKEVATAIGNNPDFYRDISQLIQNKADSSTVTEIQGIVNQNKDDVYLIKLKNESQDGILAEQSKDIQDLKSEIKDVSIATEGDIIDIFNKKVI